MATKFMKETYIYYPVYPVRRESNSSYIFFENLVDINEVHLAEATFNLHTHARILSHWLIASGDGKQHFSEVVFTEFGEVRSPREPYQKSKEPAMSQVFCQ